MLICPLCQFENPNSNKFCQRCGTSLTHKVCPECGNNVALNAKRCQNCGTVTGTVWWAIISRVPDPQPANSTQATPSTSPEEAIDPLPLPLSVGSDQNSTESELEQEPSEPKPELDPAFNSPPEASSGVPPATQTEAVAQDAAISESLSNPQTVPLIQAGEYLDPQQRYQLLEPLAPLASIPDNTEMLVRVLDCQPFQVSPLAALVAVGQDKLIAPPDTTNPPQAAGAERQMAMTIPNVAKAYLALQSQFYQMVPTIHDVWQQEEVQVLLIEDRSEWPELIELWHDDETTSLQQILHWLYEMTQLWVALEPWHYRQSLLEVSNLRVDEDQALALQRLYAEPEAEITLKQLGRVWQRLFQESQRTQFGSLVQLLHELQGGSIQSTDDLYSRLEAIAKEMQVIVNSTPNQPDAKGNLNSSAVGREEGEVNPAVTTTPTVLQRDDPEDIPTRGDDVPTIVLPMQLISLEDAGRTDVGRQRHHNEDYFGIETAITKAELPKSRSVQARGLYILCDGMGGHAGGEVASTLAVKTLKQYFQTNWLTAQLPTEDIIREAVRLANQAIYDVNQQDARSGIGRMGTTLVLVLIQDTQVAVAHVGDSRLYRLSRKRGLEQITIDHEVGQREIFRGVEPAIAYARADAYQLTQALGPRDENYINPDVQFLELNEDTLLILASDGLSDNDLLEHHWHTHLEPLLSSRSSLERGVSDLVDLANQYNGHDNITAVVIRAKVRPNLEQQL